MAEQQKPPPDPLTLWRDMAAQTEEQWNQYLNQVMGSENFAATMGRSMEAILTMQNRLAQQFETTLKAWNLPTRGDIIALGERLTEIEERLDRLADLADRDRRASARPRTARPPRPDSSAPPVA